MSEPAVKDDILLSDEDQPEKLSVVSEKEPRLSVKYLVRALVKYSASDLHIKAGRPPLYRINGKLVPSKMPDLTPEGAKEILYEVLTQKQIATLEKNLQLDMSFSIKNLGRFRCNIFHQRGSLSAAVRIIPFTPPQLSTLGVPDIVKNLCLKPRGLFLITGATGTGKSTTLASIIQYINDHRYSHVLSIEEPIEYVFKDNKSSITQREIGVDTHSFKDALYGGLRQDPDVISMGELRSMDSIEQALTAAETGHLVLGTMHTNDAKSSVERVIDVFPAEAQNQIRIQLASTLLAVVSQQLVMRVDQNARALASEVLIKSPTVEKLMLENKVDQIDEAIENSTHYYKMQSFNQDLQRLVETGQVSIEEALKISFNPEDLKLRLSGVDTDKKQ